MNRLFSILSIATLLLSATSCKKENSATEEVELQAAVLKAQAISLVANVAAPGDSIYAVNTCRPDGQKTIIAFTSLPASVTTYLNENYVGYTPIKAIAITTASGTLDGYVVALQLNGSPVALKFDASGTFVNVLEQREGFDLRRGRGHHPGGRFGNRDGRQKDTIALVNLPAAIKAYFTANYATDTLAVAFINRDSNYVVISKNNGIYATGITQSGVYISRAQLPAHQGRANPIEQSALPAAVTTYLNTTYPGYVFSKAFVIAFNTTTRGYVVIIEANTTRYAVQFDATGAFVKAKVIR